MTVDVGPVMLRGAVQGTRVRVVWYRDVLHVVHNANRIDTYQADEPVLSNGTWRTTTEAGDVSFTRRGCSSCGYRLGSIPISQIVDDYEGEQ